MIQDTITQDTTEHDVPNPALPPAPITHEPNPYIWARKQWDERYGDVLTRARNWRLFSVLLVVANIVLILGMISITKKSHVIPYIVEVDRFGRTVAQGPAEQANSFDSRLIQSRLTDWIEWVRTVSNDPQVEQHNIDRVYSMIDTTSAAYKFLNDYYSGNNPFKRATTATVTVEIHSFVQVSDKTYEVTWTETERDLHGEQVSSGNYTASITVALSTPTDEQVIRMNPFGIYVNRIGWSKVLQ